LINIPSLIIDLSLILSAAAVITLLFRKIKQPVVLGYIIAGLLVGPNIKLFPTVVEVESIKTWADIGVIFLLFGLGLEFSFKKLIKVGGVALVTALIEVTLTMLLGYGVGKLFGWNDINSLFLGGMLAIASTTIIIRAFDELGVKNKKFAGIVTGVLVIEDLVAVLLMVLLSTVAVSQTFVGDEMIRSVLKLAFILVLWFVSGIYFLPTLFRKISSVVNNETLLIMSLALCFLMVLLATYAGYSPALGAFIMGSVLAETTKAEKIIKLTKSVKNLFGAIFFVSVGMLIDPGMMIKHWLPILAGTLVLLIGKPIFVTSGALVAGQPLKIAVQSGMSLSQIGEFSFIIATLGLSLNVTSDFLYPVAVAVSVLTTFTTPLMIHLSEPVYKRVEKLLPKKWKTSLDEYSVGAQNITEKSEWKQVLRSYVTRIIIFSVIIVAIILLSTRIIAPLFYGYQGSEIITVIVYLVVLSPFLWALAFHRDQSQAYANVWLKNVQRGPLIVMGFSRIALAVFYIGFLLDYMFSPFVAFVGAIIFSIILAILSERLKAFYGKIESRFLTNFNEREAKTGYSNELLAPWDAHIGSFELDANSPYIGKTLKESKIREEFGINIAAIERGEFLINVPTRDNHLYPDDRLLVIGTDEQLERFKIFLESTKGSMKITETKQNISLNHFTIGENSSLVNKTLRESGIRERTKGLVVGIERHGERILNPESNLIFQVNDKVWIVGNQLRIQVLINELTGL
jgi:CPA2 family monovalent cation:H+ antiporter-2